MTITNFSSKADGRTNVLVRGPKANCKKETDNEEFKGKQHRVGAWRFTYHTSSSDEGQAKIARAYLEFDRYWSTLAN